MKSEFRMSLTFKASSSKHESDKNEAKDSIFTLPERRTETATLTYTKTGGVETKYNSYLRSLEPMNQIPSDGDRITYFGDTASISKTHLSGGPSATNVKYFLTEDKKERFNRTQEGFNVERSSIDDSKVIDHGKTTATPGFEHITQPKELCDDQEESQDLGFDSQLMDYQNQNIENFDSFGCTGYPDPAKRDSVLDEIETEEDDSIVIDENTPENEQTLSSKQDSNVIEEDGSFVRIKMCKINNNSDVAESLEI